ncbi:MAG: hypothetical protein R2797_02495 [Gelidibacter sp.]
MNLLKKAMNATIFAVIISSTFQCASPKVAPTQQPISEFQMQDPIVFQEWYAGIKVGGTGINMFVPKFNTDKNIQIDSVYFRNMKGKLVSGDSMYSVVLKNDSPNYVPNPSTAITNPFNLTPNECIISYTENGQIKYLKIASIVEKAGTYYEDGPPAIYDNVSTRAVATVEQD